MPRLSVLDILHRGVVYSLVGLSIWGIGMSIVIHRDTIQRGKGLFNLSRSVSLFSSTERYATDLMARREAAAQLDKIKEEEEMTLAEAAQSALPSRQ